VMAITFPVTARQLYERTVFPKDDVYIYFPFGASQAFSVLEKHVGQNDITLVDPLFAPQFAAMTGKHVFVSNMFSTVDYDRKIKETAQFLYESMPAEEKMTWLRANNISYIFTYAWTPIDLPGLTELYKNLYAVVYKVNAIP
jgi:hypothetical protein